MNFEVKSSVLAILLFVFSLNTDAASWDYDILENDSIQDTSIYSSLKINPEMLERFNNFLKKAFPENFEKYTLDFSSVNKNDLNNIRALWDQYLYGEYKTRDSIEQAVILKHMSDSIAQALIEQQKSDTSSSISSTQTDSFDNLTLHPENNNTYQSTDKEVITEEALSNQAEEVKLVHESSVLQNESTMYRKQKVVKIQKDVSNYYPGGVEYRVQIAASRNPMEERELSAIYLGPVRFSELFEDNWYKYVSDPFGNFNEANDFRISSDVTGAFVVYYYQGQRIKKPGRINIKENKIYKIQIAASKRPLREQEISTIYSGTYSIEIQYDGIWYHYLIHSGTNLEEARKKLIDVPVNGAFIVIYKGGNRIYPPLPDEK